MRLRDRVVVVTGGGQGIGRAIVDKCHAEGAHVAAFDVDEAKMAEARSAFAASDRAPLYLACDITREDQVAAATGRVL